MIPGGKAIDLINDLISTEVDIVKAINTGSGRVTKVLQAREHKAIRELFVALTDVHPTEEQIIAMENV